MTKNEYLQFLSMNNWVNLKRLIQMTLDDEYERMKQFDCPYPKININDIIDYIKDKYIDVFTHIKIKNL